MHKRYGITGIFIMIAALAVINRRALFLYAMEVLSTNAVWGFVSIAYALWLFKGGKRAIIFIAGSLLACVSLWFLNVFNTPYEMQFDYDVQELTVLTEQMIKNAKQSYTSEFELHNVLEKSAEIMQQKSSVIHPFPCPSLLDKLNISGIFLPFTGRAYVNMNEIDFLLPFIAAHELSHRSGILDEGQANVDAFLKCTISGEKRFRYSAQVYALKYALAQMEITNETEYFRLISLIPDVIMYDLNRMNVCIRQTRSPFSNYSDIIPGLLYHQSITSQGVTNETRFVLSVPSLVTKTPATRISPAFLFEKAFLIS